MTQKIRILIVDDAVVVRTRVTKVLSTDQELEVVGAVANGRIALAKIPLVNPDILILDLEMPEMDGLETLAAIQKTYPLLPAIVFSTLTEHGAVATLEALALGAADYATKPTYLGNIDAVNQYVHDTLVPKIKALTSRSVNPQRQSLARKAITLPTLPLFSRGNGYCQAEILAVGASTGGPNALSTLLSELPPDLPIPIVIVQHMPPMFTKLLAERLACKSRIQVREAVPGAILEPGHAWIAPGDFHMIVERHLTVVRIDTHQEPPENSCRPAVDVLFRSVAEVYGSGAIAVVLTGMGQDGLRGCKCIRQVRGQIIAQDEASSVVWGMPGYVANAGLADEVLPLEQIGGEIIRRVKEN